MTASTTLSVRVASARMLNPFIRELRLQATDAADLPGYTAGSHLRVQVHLADGRSDWRHYSLIDFGTPGPLSHQPAEYVIAVRRDDTGRGGSLFMHDGVAVGNVLSIEPPKNEFSMGAHVGAAVLLAGGIGITPLASMAAQRRIAQLPVRMTYVGRSRALMAYLPEMQALLADDLTLHADDETGSRFDVAALLRGCSIDDQIYVCGPKPLLEAVQREAAARGWARERVHFEVFSAAAAASGDHAFEVVLAQSGRTLDVPADKTILQCLIDAGCDPMFDCQRGECGVCALPVVEGAIDHRDFVLTGDEKNGGKVMQVCVSRAKGPRLVLDA